MRRIRLFRGPRLGHMVVAMPILTERLVVRPWTSEDRDDLSEMVGEVTAKEMRRLVRADFIWQVGDHISFAMESNEHHKVIGEVTITLHSVEVPGRAVEVGWSLNHVFEGNNYAYEAVTAVLEFAYFKIGADKATAKINAKNKRSIALAERLGFDLEYPTDGVDA